MPSGQAAIPGVLTGIGRATALAFARDGTRIVVSGRRDDEGGKLVAELRDKLGVEAEFVRSDVRYEDDVRRLVDQTVARFGRLDVAVNNAGTEGTPGPVTEQSPESYAATFDTNVLGTLLSMKHELRVMQAQGHGSIVNVSSTLGQSGGAGACRRRRQDGAVTNGRLVALAQRASSAAAVSRASAAPRSANWRQRPV